MEVKLELPTAQELAKKHGLKKGGVVQKFVDIDAMRYMSPYMPRRQAGELEHMMILSTVAGSGEINIPGPYAHYLHEGVVYEDPKYHCAGWISKTPGKYYGQWYSRKGVKKVKTNRELTYTNAPMRGKKFFDRMKADHGGDILRETQAFIDSGKGKR